MIELTKEDFTKLLLNAAEIVAVTDATHYHGTRSCVKVRDGGCYIVYESVDQIKKLLAGKEAPK